MVGVISALLLAPQTGILVVDNLAVAIAQQGQWKQMDSIYSQNWPKMNISESAVKAASSGSAYLLSGAQAKSMENPGLKWGGDEAGPGDRGWTLAKPLDQARTAVWLGAKPVSPAHKVLGNSSPVYKKAVTDYLKAKGLKKPTVLLHHVIQADLDGNGTQEVMIFAASKPDDQVYQNFMGNSEGPKTEHFSLALIRSVSGKSVKTTEMYYSDGRKGGLEGHMSFAGLWELDGRPGLEIVTRWSAYEAGSGGLARFSGGKYVKIAEAGDGV